MLRMFVLAALVVAGVGVTCAADWPQWGGAAFRNLASAERGLPASSHSGKRRRDHFGFDPDPAKNVREVARIGGEN